MDCTNEQLVQLMRTYVHELKCSCRVNELIRLGLSKENLAELLCLLEKEQRKGLESIMLLGNGKSNKNGKSRLPLAQTRLKIVRDSLILLERKISFGNKWFH